MNVQDEIKELRNKLEELERQVEGKKITGRYKPQHLESYFYIDSTGTICRELNHQFNMDFYRISTHNCFRTMEEAMKHKRILINTQKLKDLAERLNKGVEIDWNKGNFKNYIRFDGEDLEQYWDIHVQAQGVIYCLDENFLDKAIEEIGKKGLIELIEGE